MKAADWAKQYEPGLQADFLKAFADETATLVTERTKNSGVVTKSDKKVDTKPAAIEGVVREQRQKWQAVVRKVNDSSLTNELFDNSILAVHLPEVAKVVSTYHASRQRKQEEGAPQDGRKLAQSVMRV